ncbi:hypothetical protein [Paenibacillus sp. LjRoot153]|uniref:hypothetical protein n=1 Tax=Paenibacillus sp. LjRoot153 TaxID=3342270 RepID=UPI003F50C380
MKHLSAWQRISNIRSAAQIETARKVVSNLNTPITFIEAPMVEIPGLPLDHFDKALSIYALGWTVNLQKTLTNIYIGV